MISNGWQNKHSLGDQWNGEDLSIFSLDDRPLPLTPYSRSTDESTTTIDRLKPGTKDYQDQATVNPGNLKKNLQTPSIASEPSDTPAELTNAPGFRAAEAYVRPSGIYTNGRIQYQEFDLRNCIYTFKIEADTNVKEETPTELFLPEFHFPKDQCKIEVSGGKWSISAAEDGHGLIQVLKWWHLEGEQQIKITGVQRRQNMALGKEEEEGYLDQCQQSRCSIM